MAKLNTLFDHYLFGGIDGTGTIKQVWGNDALNNAILVWLSSYQGDFLRNPAAGGYLTKLLMKPMSEQRRKQIIDDVKRGLFEEFQPKLENVDLTVVPDYDKKMWNIQLTAYAPDVKQSIDLNIQVKNLV